MSRNKRVQPIAVAAIPGRIVDTNSKLSSELIELVKQEGYLAIARYVPLPHNAPDSDLDAKELAAILAAGLSVLIVQHVREPGWNPAQHCGETDARTAIEFAQAAGYAPGSHVFLDLEGISGTGPDTRTFAESWAATISAAGYRAGCYVGYNVPLNAEELYALHTINSYWSDPGNRAVATRGFALKQHESIRIGGVPFDPDTVQVDMLGQTPLWTAPITADVA